MLRRPLRPVLLLALLVPVLALAGCGGGDGGGGGERSIDDVRTCLEDAGLTLGDPPGAEDPNVADGVLATTGVPAEGTDGKAPPAAEAGAFLMALAAEVKDEATVEQFEEDSDSLAQTLSQGGAEKLEVDSGSDGRYVWAVAGAPDAEAYDEARDCVER